MTGRLRPVVRLRGGRRVARVTEPDPPADPHPSLAVIDAQLDRSELSFQQRAQSLDGKAGLILGAAGVVVALASADESILRTVGQGFAVAAGAAAAWAFLPRTGGTIDPAELRALYLDQPEFTTRLTLLSTRVVLNEADERSLRQKFGRLLLAVAFLLVAAVAVFAGSVLDLSSGGPWSRSGIQEKQASRRPPGAVAGEVLRRQAADGQSRRRPHDPAPRSGAG